MLHRQPSGLTPQQLLCLASMAATGLVGSGVMPEAGEIAMDKLNACLARLTAWRIKHPAKPKYKNEGATIAVVEAIESITDLLEYLDEAASPPPA